MWTEMQDTKSDINIFHVLIHSQHMQTWEIAFLQPITVIITVLGAHLPKWTPRMLQEPISIIR